MFDDTGKANWRHRLTTERLAHIAHELFIVHPDLRIVYSKISHLNRRCVIEGKGKGMLIIANSGMGKSRLAKLFLQRNEADHSGTVSRVPVVVFSSPVDPSRKQLGIALLAALGDPVPKKSDAEELFRRAIKLIKKIETKIIFIDNVQDVPDRRGTNVVMGIGNWIRDLIEQSQCLVVLLGTPAAKEIV
ncbi:TniB family NTP-binding protein, partial [Pseudoduganella sp. RAF53_2]